MAQQVLLKCAGLYSFPNRLGSVPSGALLKARNIVINRDNIAESRRGFKIYGNAMGSGSSTTAHQLMNYKTRILRHYGTGSGQYLEYDNGSGTFATFKFTLTGDTTNTSTTVSALSTTANMVVGMFVSGTGIPSNTTISSITNNTTIVLSQAATATNTGVTLTFTYKIEEVDTGLRIKSVEQNGNLYFTTADGIKKVAVSSASDLSSAKITSAGGIKALDVYASINNTAGFLTAQHVVAYRIVWGIRDANNNLILGSPSERVILKNTDSTDSKTVDLRITIPKGVTTSHFYQVYRTAILSYVSTFTFSGDTTNTSTTVTNIADTSGLSVGMTITGTGIPANTTISSIPSTSTIVISQAATATNTGVNLTVSEELDEIDPGDEQGLVYENNPASADITNGYVTVNDITPESFRGANLYTNADSGDGIDQANDVPPLAKDITAFKGFTFYANTETKQRLSISMLSITELEPYKTGSITANSMANPTVVTSANHGLTTGRSITISGSNSTPTIDGTRTVTVIDADTFSVPVNVTVAGTAGTWTTTDHSTLTITDGSTTNIYKFTTTNLKGDITSGSDTIINISSTSGLTNGLSVSGSGIPDGSTIVEIVSATSIRISQNATATTASNPLVFATESISSKYVALSQLATPSQQVDETARSLVRIINNQSAEIINASYISGVNDVPGSMVFEARQLNQTAFYLNVSDTDTGGQFSPTVPTAGQTVISTNEVSPNRIYYSKYQQPEAVPILNYIDVGPKDKEIVRAIALRDSLFILKEEGIYRLSGNDDASFQVTPFDFSTVIKAVDSAVVLNNLIYVYTNQGIATISDSGVSIISRPIEDQLIKLFSPQYTNFETATFGVSYESDRAYYLFTVEETTDEFATQCFRFNTFTNTWTLIDKGVRSGIVNSSDDKLYLAPTDTNFIEQERKSFDRTDYADREHSFTLADNCVDTTNIAFPSLTNINVGDVFVQTQYLTIAQFNRLLTKLDRDAILSPHDYYDTQEAVPGDTLNTKLDDLIAKIAADPARVAVAGATAAGDYTALSPVGTAFADIQTAFNSLITLLNNDAGVGYSNYNQSSGTVSYEVPVLEIDDAIDSIVTDYTYPIIAGPVTVYNKIDTEIQFLPQILTDVSITKQASEGTFIFEDSSFREATVSYSSDLSGDFEETTIAGNGTGIFGSLSYGNGVYGGNGSGIPFRTLIPREKQRCRYLNCRFEHSIAREIFSLYGVSITFNPTSQRGWR
jgi:hypothetical protein